MKRNNQMRRPSEDNLEAVGFNLGWGFYLFIGIFWWMVFGGWGTELMKDYEHGLNLIVGFIFIIGIWPAIVFTLIFIMETLDFFGIGKKEKSISIVRKQKPENPVYQYTQSATQTINQELTPHSAKSSSPSVSVPKDKLSTPTEKILPPENFFSIPRKIDWDTLNKNRKHNGDLGEMFVYDLEVNYLTKIGRSDLAQKVQHVASEGDGHGYDIKSFHKDGSEKFIEVKTTNASSGSTFNISKNEFNFLQTHLKNAVVYHVHNVNSERETTVVIYPAGEVVNSPNISPSGYVVKM